PPTLRINSFVLALHDALPIWVQGRCARRYRERLERALAECEDDRRRRAREELSAGRSPKKRRAAPSPSGHLGRLPPACAAWARVPGIEATPCSISVFPRWSSWPSSV